MKLNETFGGSMQINKRTIDMLLSLNDKQLMEMVNTIVAKSGIDLSVFNISKNDIESIRKGLRSATDEDIKKAQAILDSFKH